uniref:ATP synthase F0 subunit 8 n=1 Tax=Rhipicephalus zambeziensis TaxID=60191 RepID=UPI002238CE66|nr:ATP synthase F0 subunit 8 [Rhipicephalus zambeziensis]QLD97339.1 ATP synthase F0 subunit 8 [Rhipicephalus zambeziensis]QLD97352.1 ATP synthase F0 subunit 8 [Rhipicephalus zambeziensis]UYB78850.1 ATP synthase F0 subunit 8 [Rhipicephalus zambeziensis]
MPQIFPMNWIILTAIILAMLSFSTINFYFFHMKEKKSQMMMMKKTQKFIFKF